ncbi:MAG: NUDIX domain-containing protein [Pseudonocardiaceae bacterium]|nr:NUDIX domain-containing protein [Pseudonocardiaceae bacterium]
MELLPFDDYVAQLNRKRMSAGVLFYDAAGRVLLVEPSYKPHWDIPGGAVDAGEAPWTTAAREVREEIGIEPRLGRLLVIDYVTDDGRMPEGVAFVFDGGQLDQATVAELALTDPEIVSVRLCSLDDVASRVKPSLAARLRATLEALADGTTVLCEEGNPIGR